MLRGGRTSQRWSRRWRVRAGVLPSVETATWMCPTSRVAVNDELLPLYDAIPTGVFAATLMRQALTRAEQASASGDVVAMLRCYDELKGFKA